MVCRKSSKKWKRIMARVRKQYPTYGLKRRLKIVRVIVYRSKR